MLFENPYDSFSTEYDEIDGKWWDYLIEYVKNTGATVTDSTVGRLNGFGDNYARVDVE